MLCQWASSRSKCAAASRSEAPAGMMTESSGFTAARRVYPISTVTLLELFRHLTSFTPKRQSLAKAPWEEYVEWAVGQGLAPLSAYTLEYRFAGAGAPEWARDRLLGIYQGLMNDNVMKLVNFKRSVDALEGRRVVMLGSATFAEHLYPHVAFRPVSEIRLFMASADVEPLAG